MLTSGVYRAIHHAEAGQRARKLRWAVPRISVCPSFAIPEDWGERHESNAAKKSCRNL
jgi:hypothetical protein